MKKGKGNVLAGLLATVGIMLFGTLAVSADAHAGIQSASGKSSVPTAIAENESGAVTSAKASVGKSRKAKASANAVADSGLYQVKIAGDICPSSGSRAMDLINKYRKENGKSSIERDNTRELMAITRAGEISVYYNAMRPSGTAGSDLIIGFYDEDKDVNLFHSQTTKSSNTKVISATQDGILKAKYPGVAKVTVKPASGSGLSMSKTLVVLPSKVTGVKLTAKKKAMKVAWKKTAGASGYKVYRATSKKGKYTCVKTASSKTTSFTNKKLKKNKKYYYKVCAFVKSGKKTYNGAYSTVVMKKAK